MKRTVGVLILAAIASVFFTGCNSLVGSMEVDVKDVGTSVAAEEDGTRASEGADGDDGGARLNYTDEERNKEVPDYFEQMTEKRENITSGKQAFRLMDGYTEDISDFQIGELRGDRTFIYGYTAAKENDPAAMIHCGAFYNYESGAFRVFHKNPYRSSDLPEDRQVFYLQVCSQKSGGSGEIFVYDNGFGYIYDRNGNLQVQVDLETYVRRQYPNAYALTINKAVTDGDNRIYMELSIEKEIVDIPPGTEIDINSTMEADDEADEEAEQLDQEMTDKVEEVILVYELQDISSDMTQNNVAFENQKKEWAAMTEGEEFEEEPDAEEDWTAAVEKYPDTWDGVKLTNYKNLPMYQWKGEEKFLRESSDGLCTFVAYPNTYTFYTDLKEKTDLIRAFYAPDGHYSRIYGRAGKLQAYEEETFTREFTYVWYEEETDEKGNTTKVKHSEQREQSLTKTKMRKAPLEQSYTEGFWNLKGVSTLGNSLGSDIICMGEDGKVKWIRPGGELKDAGVSLEADYRVGVISNGSETCLVSSDMQYMYLISDKKKYQVEYKNLGGGYEKGSSAYDQMFENLYEDEMFEDLDLYEDDSYDMDAYIGGDFYTEQNVLRVNLNINEELADQLREKDPEGDWPERGGTRKGYLLTSQSRGLTYYDPDKEEGFLISDGFWFQSFLLNGKVVLVGFAEGDVSYSMQNMAKARVYEYNLDAFCEAQMRMTLEKILAEEEAERIEESQSAAAAETEKRLEGVENPMDQWNQDYMEKYEREIPSDAS